MKKCIIILAALAATGLSVAIFSNKIEKIMDNELLEANVEALTDATQKVTGPKKIDFNSSITCANLNETDCSL